VLEDIGVPWICWVQDPLPNLVASAPTSRRHPLQFCIGHHYERLFTQGGFERARFAWAPVPAARSACGADDASQNTTFDSEIAYVSNQSETPGACADRLGASLSQSGLASRDAVSAALEAVRSLIESRGPRSTRVMEALKRLAWEVASKADARGERRLGGLVFTQLIEPIAERCARHQMVRWAAQIAQERGWRFALYGRGWDRHPEFASWARGPLSHGSEVARVYRRSAVGLHASPFQPLHQRVAECAFGGGLPLVRWFEDFARQPADAIVQEGLWDPAGSTRDEARRRASWPGVGGDHGFDWWVSQRYDHAVHHPQTPRVAFRVADHAGLMHVVADHQRRGIEMPWLSEGCVRLRPRELCRLVERGSPSHREQLARILPDPGEACFADAAQLESLIERAINEPAWRSRMSRRFAEGLGTHHTYESVVRTMIDLIADGPPATEHGGSVVSVRDAAEPVAA